MKTKCLLPAAFVARLVAGFVACRALCLAAPLAETTAVHTKPDPAAPAVAFLKAGTEPTPAAGGIANTPAGWMAIDLPGPFEGYVENKDLTKALDVKPGAPIRIAPKADAGVLAMGEKGDKSTITGIRGRWTQISLEKPLTGYIRVSAAPGYMPPIATAPAAAAPADTRPASPAPMTPTVYGTAEAGRPAPMVDLGDGGSSALPRQFVGRFVSTRRPLAPRRPYDYALNDDAGKRYAYLDTSKLQMPELERYLDHAVVVYGAIKTTAGSKDLVIHLESLQLR